MYSKCIEAGKLQLEKGKRNGEGRSTLEIVGSEQPQIRKIAPLEMRSVPRLGSREVLVRSDYTTKISVLKLFYVLS